MPDPSTNSGSTRTESRVDWKPHIRSRLASLRLSPSRESEIVEELSQTSRGSLARARGGRRVGGRGDEAGARRVPRGEYARATPRAAATGARTRTHHAGGFRRTPAWGSLAGPPLCRPHAEEATNLRARGHPDARPRHRRQHRHLHRRQRHTPATPAGARSRSAGLRAAGEERRCLPVSDVHRAPRRHSGVRRRGGLVRIRRQPECRRRRGSHPRLSRHRQLLRRPRPRRRSRAAPLARRRRDSRRTSGRRHQPRAVADAFRRPARHHRSRDPSERDRVHDRGRDPGGLPWSAGRDRAPPVRADDDATDPPPAERPAAEHRELAVPPGTPQAGSNGDAGARGDRDAGDDPCARSESIDDGGADARRADRRGQSGIAPADARGRVPARRRGRGGAADCVREYREPAAGEGHGASARAGRAPRDRRQSRAARAATADRERAAVGRRRHRRARPGVGAGAGVPGLSAAGGCASRRDRPCDRSARAALLDRALADCGPRVWCCAGVEGVAAGPGSGAQGGVQRGQRRRTSIRLAETVGGSERLRWRCCC